jgi:hypothetical protein
MKYKSPFDFDVSKMTVEEVKERLRADGIPVGEWVSNEGHVNEGDKAQLTTFKRYAELLGQLRDLLQQQADRDVKQIDDLSYQLRRLKHGGGR